MTPLLASLLAVVLTNSPTADPDAAGSSLNYSVQFDEATGSAALSCDGSSTGSCTFWFGDGQVASAHAAGSGTLAVGSAPAIVRVSASHAAYCVSVDPDAPPRWPECTRGPLGGPLDRTETVDYRRH